MNFLKEAINHRKNPQKDQLYDSYFDERKRNLNYKAKIQLQRVDLIKTYDFLLHYLTKEFVDFDVNHIILSKSYKDKKVKQITNQILDYEKNKFISFLIINNQTKNYITYYFKIKKTRLIIKIKQTTVYPYMVWGPKGNVIKWENKKAFKEFIKNLKSKLNNI